MQIFNGRHQPILRQLKQLMCTGRFMQKALPKQTARLKECRAGLAYLQLIQTLRPGPKKAGPKLPLMFSQETMMSLWHPLAMNLHPALIITQPDTDTKMSSMFMVVTPNQAAVSGKKA